MTQYQNQSILISNLLSDIGYGEQMLAFRRKIYRSVGDALTKMDLTGIPFNIITVGSKAEGLTAVLENDIDIMEILPDAVCKEHSNSITHEEEHQFKLVLDYSRPGYSILRTVYIFNSHATAKFLYESMIELAQNSLYLSSCFFKNEFQRLHNENNDLSVTHGPSIILDVDIHSLDCVPALKCECPSYLSAWLCRKRNYQWPPIAVIREVSSLDSHVVPVGHTTSCYQFLEWRICYTKGEIRLVHSLNDCLIKVLILLKQIAKVTLKPLSKDMSSYLMKNVVFWLAELNDYDYFTQYALILALKKALAYLKHFVVTNNFPSYMIPQRNLLEGKLTHSQRMKICMRIDSLLKEGPYIVLKIAKIRPAILMRYRSLTESSRVSKNLQMIQIIKKLIDYFLHVLILEMFFSINREVDGDMLSDRMLDFLYARLCLLHRDNNNVAVNYEDIEEEMCQDILKNLGDSWCGLETNIHLLSVLS